MRLFKQRAIVYFCLVVFATTIFCSCNRLQEPDVPVQFTAKAPLPVGRASAAAFVANGKAYVLCGRNEYTNHLNDIWRYDAQKDLWEQMKDLPFKGRVKAVAQVVGNKAYVGLGYVGEIYQDSCYLHDFWEYTPETDTWKRCADFPSKSSDVAVSFTLESTIYVALGFFDGFTTEVYKYTPSTNTWTACENAQMPDRGGATGCSNGVHCYAGTGYNTTNLNDWWKYLPQSDKWQRLADIPGKGREFASAVTVGERIFVLGGRHFGGSLTTGFLFDDLLEYDAENDKWLLLGHLPQGGCENMITFSINGKGYFGGGENADGKILNNLYSWDD